MNEDEAALLAHAGEDPWKLAAEIVGDETKALFITRGKKGATWVAASGFDRLTSEIGAQAPDSGTATVGSAAVPRLVGEPDPTGCGDVWGMVCFASLLGGASLKISVERATELASRSAGHRGASRLGPLLQDGPRGR